ncbi:MAG: hypothetical protein KGN77_02030 [Xanthomonadaceae bacterium]|nr:hypothetical protein [Xanthomonadaceae bacterium]
MTGALSVRDMVRLMGGPVAVARLCGVGASVVGNWMARGGVPARYMPIVAEAFAALPGVVVAGVALPRRGGASFRGRDDLSTAAEPAG